MKDWENFNFGLFFVHPRWLLPTRANIFTVKNMLKHFKYPFKDITILFVVITKCVIKRFWFVLNFWLNSIKIIFSFKILQMFLQCWCCKKTQVLLHEWPSWHKNSRGTAIEKQKSHYRKKETIPMTRNIAVLFLRIGKH